jgi:hypothetical protein
MAVSCLACVCEEPMGLHEALKILKTAQPKTAPWECPTGKGMHLTPRVGVCKHVKAALQTQ